jgi:hypothetical protein
MVLVRRHLLEDDASQASGKLEQTLKQTHVQSRFIESCSLDYEVRCKVSLSSWKQAIDVYCSIRYALSLTAKLLLSSDSTEFVLH